jgi:hypothetical protein
LANEASPRIRNFIEAEAQRLISEQIKILLIQYKRNENKVTADLKKNFDTYSIGMFNNIIVALRIYYPKDYAAAGGGHIGRIVGRTVRESLTKRIQEHEKISKFERRFTSIRSSIKKDFPHFTEEERNKLVEDRINRAKEEAIDKDEITEELYERVLNRLGKKKSKKELTKIKKRGC